MQPQDINVIGVHPVSISEREFDEAVESMWGPDLEGAELDRARGHTREHFDNLRLVEIEVTPPNAPIEWEKITQPMKSVPRDNWQAPYDEQIVDPARGRWAFFLHCVDAGQPLLTVLGERALPAETKMPSHLAHVKYELP